MKSVQENEAKRFGFVLTLWKFPIQMNVHAAQASDPRQVQG